MHGLSLEELALHEVVGNPVYLDNITIVTAFYELICNPTKYESHLDFSLSQYMTCHGYEFAKICPTFYTFSQAYSKFETIDQCDAIWVRAKIPHVFNFYPPTASGWRYELLNLPFLAVISNHFGAVPLLHPFVCVEENLTARLEFYEVTPPEQCWNIANAFWQLLLTCQELSAFIEVVLGDYYDEYASVVMGNDFIAGYWNRKFHLVYRFQEPEQDPRDV